MREEGEKREIGGRRNRTEREGERERGRDRVSERQCK